MIKVKATISLFKGAGKRTMPITCGYRPLFEFLSTSRTSGSIQLIDCPTLAPGEEANAEITFLNQIFLGSDFTVGRKAYFYETEEPLGEILILEILDGEEE